MPKAKVFTEPLTKYQGRHRLLQWFVRKKRSLRNHTMDNVVHHRVIETTKDTVKAGDFRVNQAEFQRLRGQRVTTREGLQGMS